MHEHREYLRLAVAPQPGLLGARASESDRIDRFQVAGIRHHVNTHRLPVCAGEDTGRADVVLHVTATQHTARVNVFKAGKDLRRRTPHDVDDDVQPSAMTHGEHGLLRTTFGGGIQNLIQQRNQRGVAFQRVTLGADVARMNGLLENIGAHQLVEYPIAVDSIILLRLHALFDPAALFGIRNMHEFDADRAAVNAARLVGDIAVDVQLGMSEWSEVL